MAAPCQVGAAFATVVLTRLVCAPLGALGLRDPPVYHHEVATSSTRGGRWMDETLYREAQREEGLPPIGPPRDKENVYRFLVKYPRSIVKRIESLKGGERTKKFNFIGALKDLSPQDEYAPGVRTWIQPFVKKHFRDGDYFRDTNPQDHSLLGPYDHTFEKQNFTKNQKEYENDAVPFDESYFRVLCSSEFTLSPAGDMPFSFRFVEAIFCGSIPIVDKEEYANGEHHTFLEKTVFSQRIGWHFHLAGEDTSSYVYNKTWANENLAKALRYHTFLQGFNDHELVGQTK